VAERYFQALRAPHEALLWFEKSAHFVNTEEAEAFHQFFVERLLGETGGADGATAAPSL
jgi:pimeloyl-ACP methyl ester carboxylesterase